MKGFYIKELRLTGLGAESSEIVFSKGLNVISGPSNTGKSYIFHCINYMFGATELKSIKESKKYKTIYLQLNLFADNSQITLSRDIGKNTIYYSYSSIDNFVLSKNNKLKIKHNKKNDDNISRFLLKLMGIDNLVYLVKSKETGQKKTLGFRGLSNLFMISETDILSEKKSPILDDMRVNDTYSISIIRYLFTMVDDSLCEEIENQNLKQAKIEANVTYIQSKIEQLIKKKENIQKKVDSMNMQEYNTLSEYQERIKKIELDMIELESSKKEYRIKLEKLNLKLRDFLLEKDKLLKLKEHYVSDLQRLEFVHKGSDLLQQLENGECPTCGQKWNLDILKEEEQNILQETLEKEHSILQVKLSELSDVIDKIVIKINETREEVDGENRNIATINKTIDKVYEEKLTPLSNIINKIVGHQKSDILIKSIEDDIKDLIIDKAKLNADNIKNPSGIKYNFQLNANNIQDVCDIMYHNLVKCNYPITTIEYDFKKNDIVIDGELRTTNGKGIRAYLYAVFSLSLMSYLVKIKSIYSRILILDSPLTTLKEKDRENGLRESDVNEVSADLQTALFKLFYDNSEGKQFIIIENKEVDENVVNGINYIKFTKDKNHGRYGFLY